MRLLILSLAFGLAALPALASELEGKARVVDGDTLEVEGAKVRLWMNAATRDWDTHRPKRFSTLFRISRVRGSSESKFSSTILSDLRNKGAASC